MNVTQLLDQDKEQIMQQLTRTESSAEAQQVLSSAMDRLLIRYNEQCEDNTLKVSASSMMQTARISLSLLDTAGETTVWENPDSAAGGKKMPVLSWIMSILGVICISASLIMALGLGRNQTMGSALLIIPMIVLALGSCVALFFAGYVKGSPPALFSSRRGKKKKKQQDPYLVVTKPDPDKCFKSLRAVALTMDRSLQQTQGVLAGEAHRALLAQESGSGKDGGPDDAQLDLICKLLEAKESGDGQFALDRIEEIPYYLHQQGIEAVELNDRTRQYFDFLPGVTTKTLRPALVKDGQALRRGLASGG